MPRKASLKGTARACVCMCTVKINAAINKIHTSVHYRYACLVHNAARRESIETLKI